MIHLIMCLAKIRAFGTIKLPSSKEKNPTNNPTTNNFTVIPSTILFSVGVSFEILKAGCLREHMQTKFVTLAYELKQKASCLSLIVI